MRRRAWRYIRSQAAAQSALASSPTRPLHRSLDRFIAVPIDAIFGSRPELCVSNGTCYGIKDQMQLRPRGPELRYFGAKGRRNRIEINPRLTIGRELPPSEQPFQVSLKGLDGIGSQ